MSGVQQVTPRGQILRWMPATERSYYYTAIMLSLLAGNSRSDSWQFLMDIWSRGLLVIVSCHHKASYSPPNSSLCWDANFPVSAWRSDILNVNNQRCLSITRPGLRYWLFPQYLFQICKIKFEFEHFYYNAGLDWTSLTLLWVSPFEIPYSHLKWIIKPACAQLRFQPRIFFFWNLNRGRSTVSIY